MPDQPSPEQQKQVDDLIFAGRRIQAIKLWREVTGTDLRNAKTAVEGRETLLRGQSPQSFAPKKAGCMSVFLFLTGGLAILGWLAVKALA